MARVTEVFRPEDHPGRSDPRTRADLAAFFAHLFPDGAPGEPHAGYAVLGAKPGAGAGRGADVGLRAG